MAILNGITIKGSEEVHQLDYDKAIANKPFYSEQGEIVEILPQADYEFAQSDGDTMYESISESNSTPNEGETYNVMWDNTEYNCVATLIDGMYALGNLGMLGMGNTTDEPFLIGIGDYDGSIAVMMFSVDTTSSHNVRIYQNSEIVHQLDPKYVDSYTKAEINEMLGVYVDEVNTLLGGED